MIHWNYRVVQHDGCLGIHEVYYDENGKIDGITEQGCVVGNDMADLVGEIINIIRALEKPILDEKETIPAVVWPVDKSIPIYHGFKWGGTHVGVDWIVPVGTSVMCIKDGEVIERAADSKTYGGYCIVKHSDGYASLYAHLSKLNVKRGDVVKAGDIVGLSGGVPGTPGAGASTGYHLHFEIRPPGHIENNLNNVDPIKYLKGE